MTKRRTFNLHSAIDTSDLIGYFRLHPDGARFTAGVIVDAMIDGATLILSGCGNAEVDAVITIVQRSRTIMLPTGAVVTAADSFVLIREAYRETDIVRDCKSALLATDADEIEDAYDALAEARDNIEAAHAAQWDDGPTAAALRSNDRVYVLDEIDYADHCSRCGAPRAVDTITCWHCG